MATINLIILIIKILGQAFDMITTCWGTFKNYQAQAAYDNADKAMDAAIASYHAAVYKKDMTAQAQALHDLATGGKK